MAKKDFGIPDKLNPEDFFNELTPSTDLLSYIVCNRILGAVVKDVLVEKQTKGEPSMAVVDIDGIQFEVWMDSDPLIERVNISRKDNKRLTDGFTIDGEHVSKKVLDLSEN